MQCSLCFVNNSPRSNQDKGWTCLCDLGYLQQAQPSNYTASNKQCGGGGCKGRMWGGKGTGLSPGADSVQPLLRAPDVIRIVCGCRHACWGSVVILNKPVLHFPHLGSSAVVTHSLWWLTEQAIRDMVLYSS